MNPMTLIGMLSGLLIVILSVWLTSYDVSIFLNLPAFLFVLGCTLAATLVSFPPAYLWQVMNSFIKALRNERLYDRHDVDEIVRVAGLWEHGKTREADQHITRIKSPFLQTGLRLVLDGTKPDDIMDLLEWRISRLKLREMAEANVFRTMGAYAPAFGMLGTLLGLVNMLYQMRDGSFDEVGTGMAVALITTFYGLLLANLIFKPLASKLEDRTVQRVKTLSMALEAITLVSEQRSPVYIRETLYSFLAEYEDEVSASTRDMEKLKAFSHGD